MTTGTHTALLNLILGGNMSSRLFQEIREQRGLAYSIYSYYNTYSDSGMLGVYMGVAPRPGGGGGEGGPRGDGKAGRGAVSCRKSFPTPRTT